VKTEYLVEKPEVSAVVVTAEGKEEGKERCHVFQKGVRCSKSRWFIQKLNRFSRGHVCPGTFTTTSMGP